MDSISYSLARHLKEGYPLIEFRLGISALDQHTAINVSTDAAAVAAVASAQITARIR